MPQPLRQQLRPLLSLALSLSILAVLSGCATTQSPAFNTLPLPEPQIQQSIYLPEPPPRTYTRPHDTEALGLLMKQSVLKDYFKEWRGVPYQWGGNDHRGIDCSAFTQRVYQELYSLDLPRKANQQSREGYKIGKNELQPGDLVFFAQKRGVDHVGVYVGDNQFMHASTSEGVTITPLDHNYWSRFFRMAKRYFEPDGSATIATANVTEP